MNIINFLKGDFNIFIFKSSKVIDSTSNANYVNNNIINFVINKNEIKEQSLTLLGYNIFIEQQKKQHNIKDSLIFNNFVFDEKYKKKDEINFNEAVFKYFDFDIFKSIKNNDLFNFWEMFMIFDIVNNKNYDCFFYDDINFPIAQSFIYYQRKFFKEVNINSNILFSNVEIEYNSKTKLNIKKMKFDDYKKKYDLFIINKIISNYEILKLLHLMINTLKKNGNFIIKVNNKNGILFFIMKEMEKCFNKVFIYKPLSNNFIHETIYIICINFDHKNIKNVHENLYNFKDKSNANSVKDKNKVNSVKDKSDANSVKDKSDANSVKDKSDANSVKDKSNANSVKDNALNNVKDNAQLTLNNVKDNANEYIFELNTDNLITSFNVKIETEQSDLINKIINFDNQTNNGIIFELIEFRKLVINLWLLNFMPHNNNEFIENKKKFIDYV